MMNELEVRINQLLAENNIVESINLVESKMATIPKNKFESIIGKDIKKLSDEILIFIENFISASNKVISNSNKNIFQRLSDIFKMKNYITAIYCEINGTHNDEWTINLFGFDSILDGNNKKFLDDFDFRTDSYNVLGTQFFISGLEEVQEAYDDYYENDCYDDVSIERSAELCSMLVTLRVQEMIKIAFEKSIEKKSSIWNGITTFVAQHDDSLLFEIK